MSPRQNWNQRVTKVLEMARDDRGDWLAALEFTADDLATAGFPVESARLYEALEIAREDGHADWLAMIEAVADDLAR